MGIDYMKIISAYLAIISIAAIIITIYDKSAAKRKKWRISENTLMTVAALGGAAAMLLTMILIRHKTKHIKFMAGLPLIMVVHVIFALFIARFILNQ